MNTDDSASTTEELRQEVATLRQQNEEHRRLASFPTLNPNPVLEFDLHGQVIYINPAAHQILSQLAQTDAHLFLPDDFAEMSSTARSEGVFQSNREIKLLDRTFEESIWYSQEYDSI